MAKDMQVLVLKPTPQTSYSIGISPLKMRDPSWACYLLVVLLLSLCIPFAFWGPGELSGVLQVVTGVVLSCQYSLYDHV